MKSQLISCAIALTMVLGSMGQALGSDYSINHQAIDFQSVRESSCRTERLVITNTSSAEIQRPSLSLDNSDVFSFSVSERRCPEVIAAGRNCRIYIKFCPPWLGDYEAVLSVDDTNTISLKGEGKLGKF